MASLLAKHPGKCSGILREAGHRCRCVTSLYWMKHEWRLPSWVTVRLRYSAQEQKGKEKGCFYGVPFTPSLWFLSCYQRTGESWSINLVQKWFSKCIFEGVHRYIKIVFIILLSCYLPFPYSFCHECTGVFQRLCVIQCTECRRSYKNLAVFC